MAWPIFKIASEASRTAPVGSIPTRSRHFPRHVVRPWLPLLLCLAGAPLAAQDSTRAAAPPADTSRTSADSAILHRPSATGNMLKSLLVPGWGQLSLGRELTALIFIAGEAGTATMVVQSQRDLNRAREAGDSALMDKYHQKREDWLVYMGINHVLSALEAYVSAKLWDFPPDLDLRAGPEGISAGASIPIRIR